jgi:hypothetical protein
MNMIVTIIFVCIHKFLSFASKLPILGENITKIKPYIIRGYYIQEKYRLKYTGKGKKHYVGT